MLKSTVKEFKMGNLTNTYMGRSFGIVLRYLGLQVDKRKLEFGVIVAATEKFDYNGKIAPSKREPSRMSGEPQAWVSVNDEILDGPLRLLKCFVYSQIHFRPSLTEVLLSVYGISNLSGRIVKTLWRHSHHSRMQSHHQISRGRWPNSMLRAFCPNTRLHDHTLISQALHSFLD